MQGTKSRRAWMATGALLGVLIGLVDSSSIHGYSANASNPLHVSNPSLRHRPQRQRRRQLLQHYYVATPAELGAADPLAAIGNPLKGLYSSPRFNPGDKPIAQPPNRVPDTIEFSSVGWDEVMTGLNSFTWKVLDDMLTSAALRDKHVAWRIVCHYPGEPQEVRLPGFLTVPDSSGVPAVPLVKTNAHGYSPDYTNPRMKQAMENFIKAFGEKYNDDTKPIAFIQLGLLGFWGEWNVREETGLLDFQTRKEVVEWYKQAFPGPKVPLVIRYPMQEALAANFGLSDDNFSYMTLYNELHGGTEEHYFWPIIRTNGYTTFWQKGTMTGETNPSLQAKIFEQGYPFADIFEVEPGKSGQVPMANRQNFLDCAGTLHASSMLHYTAFDPIITGPELFNTRTAHATMGYNFQVMAVKAFTEGAATGTVNLDIEVAQTGLAPFYHPLNLVVTCVGANKLQGGIEALIEKGMSMVIKLTGFPATAACLDEVKIALKSPKVNNAKPIKFAQATKGDKGVVTLKINLPPPSAPGGKVPAPSKAPVKASTSTPTSPPKPPCFLRRLFNRLFGLLL